jgi:HK97 family phage prohead protease
MPSVETEHPNVFTYVASNGEPDRNGNVLDPQGWDLAKYKRNPVVLFAHDWHMPPIGKTLSIGVHGHRLKATIQFPSTLLGEQLALLNANDFIRAISVGARPIEWEVRRHPEHGYPIGIHCHKQELVELSIVTIPANPETVRASLHPLDLSAPALITSSPMTENLRPLEGVPNILYRIFGYLRRFP